MTQEAAAEAAGMSRENYGKIETGKVPYSQDMLEKLAAHYRVTISHLLSVDPDKDDKPREIYDLMRDAEPDEIERTKEFYTLMRGAEPHDVDRAMAVLSTLLKR